MQIKTSIPKLHSYKSKAGITSKNVYIHPNKSEHIGVLHDTILWDINEIGHNMSSAEVVGVLEYVKENFINR